MLGFDLGPRLRCEFVVVVVDNLVVVVVGSLVVDTPVGVVDNLVVGRSRIVVVVVLFKNIERQR
jgi:hypothetical protein